MARLCPVIIVVTLCCVAPAWAGPPTYRVVDLGEGYMGEPYGLNDANLPVGNRGIGSLGTAVVWSPPGDHYELETPGYVDAVSSARGVNASGQIVGFSEGASEGYEHACIWDGTAFRWLDEPAEATNSHAFRINDAGVTLAVGIRCHRAHGPTPTSTPRNGCPMGRL